MDQTRQRSVLLELFNSVDNAEIYSEKLQRHGLSSFLAWSIFEEQCCANQVEVAQLLDFRASRAREFFTCPDGLLGKERIRALDDLRPWGDRFEQADSKELQLKKLLLERSAALATQRDLEFKLWLNTNPMFVKMSATYAEYFSGVLLDVFDSEGFDYDGWRSSGGFPVVSKPLNSQWDICWSAESRRTLCAWPRPKDVVVERWSPLDLRCYLAFKRKRGEPICSVGFHTSPFLILRLDRLVEGFGWAYGRINGLGELNFCVNAHALLYSFVAPVLESKLREIL